MFYQVAMHMRLLLLLIILCFHNASAQSKEYPVLAGEIPDKVLPYEAKYLLPAFTKGTAFLRDGSSSTYLFNYNFLLDEMHFVSASGDTLAIADPLLLSSVVIDSLVFYYDKSYMRVLLQIENYKLALKQEMVQIADKTRGGYDVPSAVSAIKTYSSISNGNSSIFHLQVQKDVLFRGERSYYITDASNHFLPAIKKNFYALFEKKGIQIYFKQHKVNFHNEADLEALMRFCLQ